MVRSEITKEEGVFSPFPNSVIRKQVIELRSSNIYMTMSDIAREVGISRQRAFQILQKAGLPTKYYINTTKYACLVCGTVSLHKFCSNKCKKEWQQIPIVCTTCGKLFTRNKNAVLASCRRNQANLFCSKYCQGKWAGEHYGFKAHRNNLTHLGRT